jgi:hypothetical protein
MIHAGDDWQLFWRSGFECGNIYWTGTRTLRARSSSHGKWKERFARCWKTTKTHLKLHWRAQADVRRRIHSLIYERQRWFP